VGHVPVGQRQPSPVVASGHDRGHDPRLLCKADRLVQVLASRRLVAATSQQAEPVVRLGHERRIMRGFGRVERREGAVLGRVGVADAGRRQAGIGEQPRPSLVVIIGQAIHGGVQSLEGKPPLSPSEVHPRDPVVEIAHLVLGRRRRRRLVRGQRSTVIALQRLEVTDANAERGHLGRRVSERGLIVRQRLGVGVQGGGLVAGPAESMGRGSRLRGLQQVGGDGSPRATTPG
jgi:hypothetical protein